MAGLASILKKIHLSLVLLPRLFIAALIFFANVSIAEEIFLTVNIKKPLAVTSDKFLSYTIDPTVILTGDALTSNPEKSVSMARALSPAYIRIGGPRSNSYSFVRPHHQSQYEEDPSFTFSETNWIDVHRWAENASLDILACIASQHIDTRGGDSIWDSRNALDLISFSDEMGFNVSWQLGYECQTRCDGTGISVGKAVTRLRSMLDAFPRYSESVITGPDVVAYRTRQQQQYLQDYLNVAGNVLSATTWHPNFAGVTVDADGVSMHHDNLAIDRDLLYRAMGRSMGKKPLWLAESKSEDCKKQFIGALVWTRRLGNAAKLGVQVIMRQPDGSDLFQPTPDYWVSVLHKRLVGREVLDTRITDDNRNHVYFWCQCTRPSSKYEKGSLTVFGINLTPSKISVGLKGLKMKTIHKYILLPGYDAENRMFSETVLLNNEPLNLVNDREVPELVPTVLNSSKVALKLPSGAIGFWVLPGLKIRSCGGLEEESTDRAILRKLFKRFGEAESGEDMVNNGGEEVDRYNEDSTMEERRHLLKSSKSRRRRKRYYSDEDDPDRRHKRFEAKTDLERFGKLLRRRDGFVDRKSPSRKRAVHFDFGDASEQELLNEDDVVESQEIRDNLAEYENKIKRVESKSPDETVNTTDGEMAIDSAKLIKAMKLLMKLENRMEQLKISNESDMEAVMTSLNKNEAKVPSGTVNSSDNTIAHVNFLNDLIKSNKFERSRVPIEIEGQLRTIYRILTDAMEPGQRKDANAEEINDEKDRVETLTTPEVNRSRASKDSDKKFSMDPTDGQKEGIFHRVARFLVEARDRRSRRKGINNRNNERPVVILGSKGSSQSQTPEDDVYLTFKNPEEKTTNGLDSLNDVDKLQYPRKTTIVSTRNERTMVKSDSNGDTWTGNKNTLNKYLPMEFSENFGTTFVPRAQKNLQEYELWEAESLNQREYRRPNADKDEATTLMGIMRKHHDVGNSRTSDLGSHGDETTEYRSAEEIENMRSVPSFRTTTMTNREVPMTIIDETANRQLKRKATEDSDFGQDENSGDFGFSYYNEPIISMAEERALSNYDVIPVTGGKRMKRSNDNGLEDVLDREMIFQDDSNLKDCDCRVTRGIKTSKARSGRKRENRENCPLAKRRLQTRSERQRNRKRDKPMTATVVTNVAENHTEAYRLKRSVEPFDDKKLEFTIEEPKIVRGNEEYEIITTTTEKLGLEEAINLTNSDNSASERDGPFYDETTNEIAKDSKVLERTEASRITESLNFDKNIVNVPVDNEIPGIENVVTDRLPMTESLAAKAEIMESSMLQDFTTAVEMNLETTGSANARSSRDGERKTEITEIPKLSEAINVLNYSHTTLLPSPEIPETSSVDNNTDVNVSRTAVTVETDDMSVSDIPEVIAKDSTTIIDEASTGNPETRTINGKKEKLASQISNFDTESLSADKERTSTSRPIGNGTAIPKNAPQRMRKSSNISDPGKLRKTQRTTSSKRKKETRKPRKRLLQKKEKLVNDNLRETFGELEKMNAEGRKLQRRDIIGMIMNDEDLHHLVDSEKIEYLLRNRPINYETTECSNSDEYAEVISKKYVPEVFEIVRPLHVTRERRVQPRKSSIPMNMDGRLLASTTPKEASNLEKIRKRLDAETADHKIGTRGGKQYYSIVESLENPQIYEQLSLYEKESDEVPSSETGGSSESDESSFRSYPEYVKSASSYNYGQDRECKYCDEVLQRNYRRVFHPEEESVRGPAMFDNPTTDTNNFPNENSKEGFSVSNGEILKFTKQKVYLDAAPIDNSWFDKRNHASKKRNLQNSDYQVEKKCDNPKYARSTVDKSDSVQQSKVPNESGEMFQEMKPKSTSEGTVKRDVENDFPIDKRMKENAKDQSSAMVDRNDLNEAIKTGHYELLLLIPVNRSQVRSRRKRNIDDEVRKHRGNSISNMASDVTAKSNMIRTPPKNNGEAMIDREIFTNEINSLGFFREPSVKISDDKKDDRNLILEASPIVIVEGPETLDKNDEQTLKESATKEMGRNNPQIISGDREQFPDDASLSELIEDAIPKLEATVSGGLGKVRRISESFEKFIGDFDERFNEKEVETDSNVENDFSISSNIFRTASTNLKKFFDFLSGLLHIFQKN